MNDFVKTLLVAIIPSIISFLSSYFLLLKKIKSEMNTMEINHKNEIEKLKMQFEHECDLKNKEQDIEMKNSITNVLVSALLKQEPIADSINNMFLKELNKNK